MTDLEIFPQAPFLETFVPNDPAGLELLRTTYLVEEYSRGLPWLRESFRSMANVQAVRETFSEEQVAALPDTIVHISGLFRDGLARELVTTGDLVAEKASLRKQDAQYKEVAATWDHIATAALEEPPQAAEETKLSIRQTAAGVTGLGLVVASMTNLDIRAMRHHQEGRPLARPDSVVRENILAGRPASSAFDEGFEAMGKYSATNACAESLSRLEAAWTAQHPDQPFWPAAYEQQVAEVRPGVPRIIRNALGWMSRRHAKTADMLIRKSEKRGLI